MKEIKVFEESDIRSERQTKWKQIWKSLREKDKLVIAIRETNDRSRETKR